jgi:hypothetical protein
MVRRRYLARSPSTFRHRSAKGSSHRFHFLPAFAAASWSSLQAAKLLRRCRSFIGSVLGVSSSRSWSSRER